MVDQITLTQAEKRLGEYGIPVLMWITQRIENGKYSAMICDYSKMKAYTVRYAIDIVDKATDRQVDRFNVRSNTSPDRIE